jgi:hypothetical protein
MKNIVLLLTLLFSCFNLFSQSKPSEFLIYPNPNQGRFEISLDANSKTKELFIYNVLGSRVFCGNLHEGKIKCDLSNLEPGLYLIKLELEENEILVKRFYIK